MSNTNYSILQLLPTRDWTKEERKELLETYQEDLQTYVTDQLESYFTDEDDAAMGHLLADPKTTNATLEKFYEEKIPNFKEEVKKLADAFKKQYVLQEYEKQIHDLEASLQQYLVMQKRLPNEQTNKIIEQQRNLLYVWRTVFEKAQSGDWNTTMQLVQEISL